MIGNRELISIFELNLINIAFSIYALVKMIYYCPAKLNAQMDIPFTKISLIEITPIIYMIIVYFVILILILSVYNHLSINAKDDIHFTIIKTIALVILIVLLIITVNAVVFFIVHNSPSCQLNNIFDGNFLKDAIKSNYKSAKAFPDCLWFSATTFFTVGYGDMHPVGNIMYLLSIMEMISAYILGIIMVPILLFKVPGNKNIFYDNQE